MVSTRSSAGWPAASIARRTAAMSEITPVEVSLCTTQTARIACERSWRRRASIRSGCAGRRHDHGRPVAGSVPGTLRNSGFRPRRWAIRCQSDANWPVSNISTASPGLIRLESAASQAPVPEPA